MMSENKASLIIDGVDVMKCPSCYFRNELEKKAYCDIYKGFCHPSEKRCHFGFNYLKDRIDQLVFELDFLKEAGELGKCNTSEIPLQD